MASVWMIVVWMLVPMTKQLVDWQEPAQQYSELPQPVCGLPVMPVDLQTRHVGSEL